MSSSRSVGVLRHYFNEIEKTYRAGNATEHTYRSDLKDLLKQLFPGVTATNEPKRVKCGAPDFIITRNLTPLGYIETKDIGISLDQVERTDQMKRYLGSLSNLILTDYVEFRWYVSGEPRMTVTADLLRYKIFEEQDEHTSATRIRRIMMADYI